ncbi:MAG TPA: FMN-binding negative transcriptional regulator [Lacunisphaera sp.]|jgi:transcriptional regulator
MYIPSSFKVDDISVVRRFIQAHGFASVISTVDGTPYASHLPVLLDEGENGDVLRGHMARANEQWKHFDGSREILCIFQGPHAYISPSWYETKGGVPTWNYTTVHAYGIPRIESEKRVVRQILNYTTEKYESAMSEPWRMNLSGEALDALLNAIIGFSIRVTRLEAKFKLGQNRSGKDQNGMIDGLTGSPYAGDRELAKFIREYHKVD